jgi:RHS repeat-associated protein
VRLYPADVAVNLIKIVGINTNDSFGKLTASTGSLVNLFQCAARESDSETGLYYYRARYYDPLIGRFTSEDPIGFNAKQFNFYSYVSNNPVKLVDPFGTCPQLDSVTKHHLDCQRIPTVKDRCACHAVYLPDSSWQEFMDTCTVCAKKDAKPRDVLVRNLSTFMSKEHKIVQTGCSLCERHFGTVEQFKRHPGEDVLPPLLNRLSSEGKN